MVQTNSCYEINSQSDFWHNILKTFIGYFANNYTWTWYVCNGHWCSRHVNEQLHRATAANQNTSDFMWHQSSVLGSAGAHRWSQSSDKAVNISEGVVERHRSDAQHVGLSHVTLKHQTHNTHLHTHSLDRSMESHL